MTRTGRRMVIVAYDGAELLEISSVTSVLSVANRQGASPSYRAKVVTPEGRPARCSSGLVLASQGAVGRTYGPVDTLIVVGGHGHHSAAGDAELVGNVRRLARNSRRVASVCTGALAFVEEDHGPAPARSVARAVVTYLHRPGDQEQISMFVAPSASDRGTVHRVLAYVAARLDQDLSVSVLAERAGVSERHLTRLFLDQVGRAPAHFVRTARTEAASHLLVGTGLPLAAIARRCGFRSTETLRQAFLSHYGTTPGRYRAAHAARDAHGASDPHRAPGASATPAGAADGTRPNGTPPAAA